MRGRAAKFALDPSVLLDFVNGNTAYRTDGVPRRTRRYINGVFVESPTDIRVLRRWRAGGDVTKAAAERLLANYELTLADLYSWSEERGVKAILRGGIRYGSR